MERVSTPAWLLGQRLPQVSADVTQTGSCSPKPTPLSAGTCNWVLSCPLLQLWQERFPQPGYRVCRALLVCSCGLCFIKWREEDFNFFYKAMKFSFTGKNISSLPAACCSLVQYSSNLFALGKYHCRMGSIHGSRWNLHMAWKAASHLSYFFLSDPPRTPSNAYTEVQKAGEGQASCCSSGPVCWCIPMCSDNPLLG